MIQFLIKIAGIIVAETLQLSATVLASHVLYILYTIHSQVTTLSQNQSHKNAEWDQKFETGEFWIKRINIGKSKTISSLI